MEIGTKRLIDITLDDLDNFLLSRGYRKEKGEEEEVVEKKDGIKQYKKEDLFFGDRELAEYLGISITSVFNLKRSGVLDGTFVNPTPHRYIYIKEKIDMMIYKPKVGAFSRR